MTRWRYTTNTHRGHVDWGVGVLGEVNGRFRIEVEILLRTNEGKVRLVEPNGHEKVAHTGIFIPLGQCLHGVVSRLCVRGWVLCGHRVGDNSP